MISSYAVGLKLSVILLALKDSNEEQMILNELINHRNKLFDFEEDYDELKRILDLLFDNFSEGDLTSRERYLKKLGKDTKYLISNLSPIYERLPEVLTLAKMSEEILFKIQFNESEKMFVGSADVFEYLTKLSSIEEECKCKTMLFIIKQAEFELLAEYTIISKDNIAYSYLKEKCEQLFSLGYDLIKNKTSILTENLKLDDLILLWNRLSYVSFCIGNLKEFWGFREKFYELIKTNEVSPTIELGYFSVEFWATENYDNLLRIIELYERTRSDDFFGAESDKEKELESMFFISKSFLESDLNKKIEYLTKALDLVEEFPVMPSSLQRDSTVIAHQKRNINLLIYLWNFVKEKNNSFFGFAELEKAVKSAKNIIENTRPQDTSRRFALKILIIQKVLTCGYDSEVEDLMKELRENHILKNDSFLEEIKEFIEFLKGDKNNALKLFLGKETPSNIWEKIIYKSIQGKITDYLGEVRELRVLDIDELLNKFKWIVERDAVPSFWQNKTTLVGGKPEDIGRNLLMVFLSALDLDPSKEEELGYKKQEDIIIREIKGKKVIIETKMGNCKSYVLEGADRIKDYCELEKGSSKEIVPYYIIFIFKNNESDFEDEFVIENNKKIKVIKIDVRSNYIKEMNSSENSRKN